MLTMYMFRKIRKLKKEGLNKSEIGRRLQINRKTVAKYLESNTPPKYERTKRTREDLFSPYQNRVDELLDKNKKLSATEIFELLVEEGYLGSERTVRRRISMVRLMNPKEMFFEQEYEAGEQSQFDFKERIEIPFEAGKRVIYLHFGTLPCSDKFFIKSYPAKNYECYMDGIHSFFEHIGGMTHNIRIDNLSPCVTKILKGNDRIYTERFKHAIKYYGFEVLPCNAGKGNEKGDVERDIRTHVARIRNLIKNQDLSFKNYDELNVWLVSYVSKRTTESIRERFDKEKAALLPLPPLDEEIIYRVEEVKGNSYGTVSADRRTNYSIPNYAIGEKCRLVIDAYNVKIYLLRDPGNCITTHERKKSGDASILLEHAISSLTRKPRAMIRWKHRDILFPNTTFKKFYSYLKSIDSITAEKDFLKCINFVQYVSLEEIEAGIDLILESKNHEPFFALKDLLFGDSDKCEVIDITERLGQKSLSPDLSIYNDLIPKTTGGNNDK